MDPDPICRSLLKKLALPRRNLRRTGKDRMTEFPSVTGDPDFFEYYQ